MTTDLEERLRRTLSAKAAEITDSDLAPGAPLTGAPAAVAMPTAAGRPRSLTRALAVAAVLVAVTAGTAQLGLDRDRRTDDRRPVTATTQPTTPPTAANDVAQIWPLNGDEPLAGSPAADALRAPDTAAQAYLAAVADVGPSWPLAGVQAEGDTAVVAYVLQDVAAKLSLARTPDGYWFVTSADTNMATLPAPIPNGGGIDVSVGPGPRTYENGSPVRITALAADGRILATSTTTVRPPTGGSAAAAAITQLHWDGSELAAAVRADVLDDHDGNPRTPPVIVGHSAVAAPLPASTAGLPRGVDLRTNAPLFSGPGSADEVAKAYVRSRFPDYPQPNVQLARTQTRAKRAYIAWSTGPRNALDASGWLFLRQDGGTWSVVAATTDGIDLSELSITDGRLTGEVRSSNINSLFADVLTPDGAVVPDAPRPAGHPGAAYRFGTAGGPATGTLLLDITVEGPTVVRVHLVGGTLLSIAEVALPSA